MRWKHTIAPNGYNFWTLTLPIGVFEVAEFCKNRGSDTLFQGQSREVDASNLNNTFVFKASTHFHPAFSLEEAKIWVEDEVVDRITRTLNYLDSQQLSAILSDLSNTLKTLV